MKPFINIAEIAPGDWIEESHDRGHADVFSARHADLAHKLGGSKIDASVTRLPPGKAAFPFHHHYGSEEHFFIISGVGTLRHGEDAYAVKPGDYMVHPPGGPETAHQLINTGTEDLVYLGVGANVLPEVVGYPDAGKTKASTRNWKERGVQYIVRDADRPDLDYWEEEDGAKVKAIVRGIR